MPTFTCEKCLQTFERKSSYDSHMNRKTPCAKKDVGKIISEKVAEGIREVSQQTNSYTELTITDDETQVNNQLQGFYENLHNLLWARAGLSPERALEHMVFFFAYRLIEQQADALNLKQECRWSYMSSMTNENDMFEVIKKGCTEFQKNTITKQFFKQPEIRKADIIYEIVKQIGRIPISALHKSDVLGDIFEYMLSRGMSTMSDEGQYFTNRKICQLAFDLAYNIKNSVRRKDGTLCTFADWFCGTGGFPAEYVKGVTQKAMEAGHPIDWKQEYSAIYCQDMNLSSVTTTLLNMLILTGVAFGSKNIHGGNSFMDPITMGNSAPHKDVEIDYCFMNPPYGGDKTKGANFKFAYAKGKGDAKKFMVNAEIQSIGIEDDDKVSAGVQLGMATLSSDGGVCSIVLPQGFFFGASKKCIELRKKIAEEYKIHYIVDIASGEFLNTGTKTSMMVFQKGVGSTEKIKFIKLDETLLVEATLDELRAKNYSLNYKQYMPQSAVEIDGFKSVLLKDICVFKRGTVITKATLIEGNVPVIGGGLSPMGFHNVSNRPKNTILISQSGENAGYVSKYNTPIWASDCFSIESNSNELINDYLYHIMKSIEPKIRELKNGTAQPHVYPSSIEHLSIQIPSLERQQQIVEAIDGWAELAHQEEVALGILEKQMMFQVKEMGRGQPRVKLGDVCELKSGFAFKSSEFTKDINDIPVLKITNVNKGFVSFANETDRIHPNPKYTSFIVKNGDSVISLTGLTEGKIIAKYTLPFTSYLNQRVGMLFNYKTNVLPDYIYYYLLQNTSTIIELGVGSCQKNVSPSQIMGIEIPLPSLAEQQTLQSDFDEIRHKHAKIANYKAKAQEAIQQLIPLAK